MSDQIGQLAELLLKARYPIAFTGAGISTESGIPDFRSRKEGLWTRIDPELLSARTLKIQPELFFQYFQQIANVVTDKNPNVGHLALAELGRIGVVRAVVTQNIDGLHQRAGSSRVLEVHGHMRSCRCSACGREYPFALLEERLAMAPVPVADCCRAVLRPNVTLFGDAMPEEFALAEGEADCSDFVLVVGTSLTVYPAADIPRRVGRFAIINREETNLDSQAVLSIGGSVGQALAALTDRVKWLKQG